MTVLVQELLCLSAEDVMYNSEGQRFSMLILVTHTHT